MALKITSLQKMNSYLFPVSIFRTSSKFNKVIEVSLENGKLVLNSKNANYSYGSLFAIFKKAFDVFRISFHDKKNVLMLGLGGGSVVKYLATEHPHLTIDAVELDPVIMEVANDYFELSEFKNITTICDDAREFVKASTNRYDLILIDLFIDTEPPLFCFEESFIKNISALCSKKGQVLFNQSMKVKLPDGENQYSRYFERAIQKRILHNSILLMEKPK
jgi:cyclopropane fatty-acyl-phospholipid synthase-like methyltransferase